MKRLKFLPSVLMLVLCVGVLCMGIYAASPNSNQITGSITINPAGASISITAWAEKFDGTKSNEIEITNLRTGGEVIDFADIENIANILKFDFSTTNSLDEVKPCYIKLRITNNSANKQLGAYISTKEMNTQATKADIFTSAPMANSDKVTATSMVFYGHMGPATAENDLTDTTTLVLEFKPNAFIESGSTITFNNYYVNIEEYEPNFYNEENEYEPVTVEKIEAVNGFVKLASDFSGLAGPPGFTYKKAEMGLWLVVPNSIDFIDVYECDLQRISLPNSISSFGITNEPALTSLVLPETLTDLGDCSINECPQLESVIFLGNIEAFPTSYFHGCTGLKSVNIPQTVTEIKQSAFEGCTALTTITLPSNLQTIGKKAFAGTGLTRVVIPESVTSIASDAFDSGVELIFSGTHTDDATYRFSRATGHLEFLGDAIVVPTNIDNSEVKTIEFADSIVDNNFQGLRGLDILSLYPNAVNGKYLKGINNEHYALTDGYNAVEGTKYIVHTKDWQNEESSAYIPSSVIYVDLHGVAPTNDFNWYTSITIKGGEDFVKPLVLPAMSYEGMTITWYTDEGLKIPAESTTITSRPNDVTYYAKFS